MFMHEPKDACDMLFQLYCWTEWSSEGHKQSCTLQKLYYLGNVARCCYYKPLIGSDVRPTNTTCPEKYGTNNVLSITLTNRNV